MHSIRVKYVLEGSHALFNQGGAVEPLHAHAWDIECEIVSDGLDDAGCVIDFAVLDRRMGEVLEPLSHTDIGEHPLFAGRSPSAEAIAEVLHGQITRALDDRGVRVTSVTVWEDDRHAGCYGRKS